MQIDKFVFILQNRYVHVPTWTAKFIYHALKKGMMLSILNFDILYKKNKGEAPGRVI